ncbi:MAG: MotA/TolQ/ExbB proton channel family protein [Candidatus Latescibacteria bacterium]|nr:MotA/TolQ/ExbB proton channel family protein [Candidatus Latescibacterota bacterium]
MDISVLALWNAMGPIPKFIVLILLALSVYTLAIMLERARIIYKARKSSDEFATLVDKPGTDINQVMQLAGAPERGDYCFLAQIVRSALQEARALNQEGQPPEVVLEAAQDTIARAIVVMTGTLRRRLVTLATTATGAPFIGLVGTIMGLIRSFHTIAATQAGGISAVSGGIAEALVTTMFGIGVAIPAMWAHNFLADRIDAVSTELDNTAARIVERLLRVEFIKKEHA